jgi:pSer/pThr/pTyr-binding forkhead associated (FHA) protein
MAANSGFSIQDLSSQNGVFVNGERVTEHSLKDGEQIVIGDSTMLFRTPWPISGKRADKGTRATKA